MQRPASAGRFFAQRLVESIDVISNGAPMLLQSSPMPVWMEGCVDHRAEFDQGPVGARFLPTYFSESTLARN